MIRKKLSEFITTYGPREAASALIEALHSNCESVEGVVDDRQRTAFSWECYDIAQHLKVIVDEYDASPLPRGGKE